MAEAFRPDGRLNIPTQAAADYIAEQGQLIPYEPTMREKTEQVITDFLANTMGMSRFAARDTAQGITGTTDPSQNIAESIGVLDFTPAGLVFGGQEAARDFGKAQTATDYIAPTIGLGLSAVEAFPLTKVATKPARAFLSSLGQKTSSDIVPAAEPLIASAGSNIPRRTFVQGMAATPVAGALSKLPLGKVDDAAAVAKAAKLSLPENFSVFYDLPEFKQKVDGILMDDIEETGFDLDDDIQDLVDQVSSADRFEVAEAYDMRDDIAGELRSTYDLTDSEIDEILEKEGFNISISKPAEIERMKSFKGSYDQYMSKYPNSEIELDEWENTTGKYGSRTEVAPPHPRDYGFKHDQLVDHPKHGLSSVYGVADEKGKLIIDTYPLDDDADSIRLVVDPSDLTAVPRKEFETPMEMLDRLRIERQ
tara:strand:+ start:12349 stop:13614 length:1266 start_codon:yes stop_codon:yes gene_type:complete